MLEWYNVMYMSTSTLKYDPVATTEETASSVGLSRSKSVAYLPYTSFAHT